MVCNYCCINNNYFSHNIFNIINDGYSRFTVIMEELNYVTGKKTLVDLPEDFAGDYFSVIHKEYESENKSIEVEQFINSDARVSMLIVDNKIVSAVFERRTAHNNVEVFYCKK